MRFLEYISEKKYSGYFKVDGEWVKKTFYTDANSENEALRNFMKRLADYYDIRVEVITRKFSQKGNKWDPIDGYDYKILKEGKIIDTIFDGYMKYNVIENPSPEQLQTLLNKSKYNVVRFLASKKYAGIYAFISDSLIHNDIYQSLKNININPLGSFHGYIFESVNGVLKIDGDYLNEKDKKMLESNKMFMKMIKGYEIDWAVYK